MGQRFHPLTIIPGTERAFKRVDGVTVVQHLELAVRLASSQNPSLLVKEVTSSFHALYICICELV